MSGLILLFILGVWLFVAKKLTSFLTTRMQVGVIKKAARVLLFVLILVAPLADEVIGGFQFRALCEAETQLHYDKDTLAGKEVYSDTLVAVKVENIAIPVVSQMQTYTESNTLKMLLNYKVLYADGGWLSRAIHFNSVYQPYTFDGYCGPEGEKVQELLKNLNVTVINDPSRSEFKFQVHQ